MSLRPNHIKPLTSLRFIAAMMIFLVHASSRIGMPDFGDMFAFGHGVSFFYVLSGFILTYVYIGSPGGLNLKAFFRSRLARLYPLHIATFIAAILLVPNVQDTLADRVSQLPFQLTMTQSWLGTYNAAFAFNGPAWSISTELGFYLIFPLLFKFYRVIYKLFFISLVFTALTIIAALYSEGAIADWLWQALHVQPLGRLVEFVAGMCAAKVFLSGNISLPKRASTPSEILIISLIILIGSLNKEIFSLSGNIKGGVQLAAYFNRSGLFVLFAVLIWVFAHANGAISRVLSHSIFVGLGKISFAFYMIHQIIISFFEQNYELLLGYQPAIVFMFLFSLALGFSYVAYKLIELPFQSVILMRTKTDDQTTRAISRKKGVWTVASLTLIFACLFPVFSPGYKGPSPDYISRFQSQAIEINIKAVNADLVLTHYRYQKSKSDICYELLWTFGDMKIDLPIERVVNIPFQDRRRTVSNEIILPPSAWEKPNQEKQFVLDKFCFATFRDNPIKPTPQFVRVTIRQETDSGFAPLKFDGGDRVQSMLLLDHTDPGPFIWLKKPIPLKR